MLDLDRPECRRLLAGTAVGRIAVGVTEFDNPVIRPVTYLFDTPSQSLHPRGWRDGDDARGPLECPAAVSWSRQAGCEKNSGDRMGRVLVARRRLRFAPPPASGRPRFG